MKKVILPLIIVVSLVSESKAQDPNFSQFFASPLTLNPALTGKFDGLYRIAGNYRNQWPTFDNAFTTATASFDMSIMRNRLPDIDRMGIGFMGFTDRSGNGVLLNNYASLAVSYHKGLDEDGFHQLGLGFQGSFVNKRLDVTKVVFEDQLTPFGFTRVTSEVFLNNQVNLKYIDLNAGILYNGSTNGYNNFYLGASMYHINRPKETFKGGQYYLPGRVTLQAGGRIPIGPYNYLHFAANHSFQANANNTMVGGAYSYNLNADESNPVYIFFGGWFRFGDAIIPYLGLEFGEFQFGATYDVNTSSLKPGSNSRGGTEISLIYIKKPADPNLKNLNCPKF